MKSDLSISQQRRRPIGLADRLLLPSIAIGTTLIGLWSVPAFALPDAGENQRVEIVHYKVEGRDAREVRDSIDARRPVLLAEGQQWDGITRWRFWLSFPNETPGECRAGDARVNYHIGVTIPELTTWGQLSPDDQLWWSDYERNLTEHEMGHVRLTVEAAAQIEAEVKASDCIRLWPVYADGLDRAAQKQKDYDRLTHHGEFDEEDVAP